MLNTTSKAEPAITKSQEPQGIQQLDALPSLQVAGFVGDSIVDGPGLRCVIFCQGCPHHCPGCHNPEALPFEGGTTMQASEVLQRIRQYPLCRGITFSGGEPFWQAEALVHIARPLKEEGYELAAYSGYTFEDLLHGNQQQQRLLSLLDVLIDGRFIMAQRDLNLRFRGSGNQRIVDVPASIAAGTATWVQAARWVG